MGATQKRWLGLLISAGRSSGSFWCNAAQENNVYHVPVPHAVDDIAVNHYVSFVHVSSARRLQMTLVFA
jgi:hypothetical protein